MTAFPNFRRTINISLTKKFQSRLKIILKTIWYIKSKIKSSYSTNFFHMLSNSFIIEI